MGKQEPTFIYSISSEQTLWRKGLGMWKNDISGGSGLCPGLVLGPPAEEPLSFVPTLGSWQVGVSILPGPANLSKSSTRAGRVESGDLGVNRKLEQGRGEG